MEENTSKPGIGAEIMEEGGVRFRIWAPKARSVALRICSGKRVGTFPLLEDEEGYFSANVGGAAAGDLYYYIPDGGSPRPDPASRYQPDGVHGASQVVDPRCFRWTDRGWAGIPMEDYVIYELHVGTFSRNGTFESVIPCLDYLKGLGITALELMPVAQFPGERNWGYDGVHPFAPQNSYGGPDGLKRLIDACHGKGLAVILDVVYNHLGPEGNYLGEFGHYFTDRYRTPWGCAINFDGPCSDPVRAFFIENARYWLTEFRLDALRLDAIHGIFDFGARHFLRELADEVHTLRDALGRNIFLIAESDLNDPRLINPPEIGGHGLDAQWNDDFHHALHVLLTGETNGYYLDFGNLGQLGKAFAERFVYDGQYSAYRQRRHGSPVKARPASQFVVFAQNHDQVGNRMAGDRLSAHLHIEKLKLAAAVVLLSPYIPLLFMGEEYGERAPFPYFISHSDPALIEAIRAGRLAEFAPCSSEEEPPDPVDEETFLSAKIDTTQRFGGENALVFGFYRRLLELRRTVPAFRSFARSDLEVTCPEGNGTIAVRRICGADEALCLFSFSDSEQEVAITFTEGTWERLLDSSVREWGGTEEVAAHVFTVSKRETCLVRVGRFGVAVYRKMRERVG